jgi:hypothetical protein
VGGGHEEKHREDAQDGGGRHCVSVMCCFF